PTIIEVGGHWAHDFKCTARSCKVTVRCYIDTKDARLTSNLRKHVKVCKGWCKEILEMADQAKNADKAKMKIIRRFLCDGKITAMSKRKGEGKGQVTYLHHQHTHEETWYPFDVVNDRAFCALMKTGRPDYYLPSAATVLHDLQSVFGCTWQWVGRMLQEYKGRISFTTDVWTSPNHCSFIAFCAHLEHKGKPLAFLLDIIEVAKVSIHQ
ncbi:hypothetical protein BS17DRAFT_715694, partial [Gyrodon lividus]